MVVDPEVSLFLSYFLAGSDKTGTRKSMKSSIEMARFGSLHRASGPRPKCPRYKFRITVFDKLADLSGDDLVDQAVGVVILLAGLCDSPGGVPLDHNVVTFSDNFVNLELAQAFHFSSQWAK